MRSSNSVIIRDLIIFQIKLFMDGLKDVVLMPLSIGAAVLDLVLPGSQPGQRFYRVIAVGEKYDRWLNLFGAAKQANAGTDGLFGASRAGSDSLLGSLEAYVRNHVEPEEPDSARSRA